MNITNAGCYKTQLQVEYTLYIDRETQLQVEYTLYIDRETQLQVEYTLYIDRENTAAGRIHTLH